eukprot:CAMPEP_0194508806 /NCGR_PEP_ID=MMETSP0253-20130528/39126_1 /TAXON_ID=2966 /ORGANISM="Noctiluca scintillans" /LENGTH=55 /DNA_ID=CAMNT_0039351877 /DNA_START=127 /DNA_END=291 /DNA_ORIENTATION=-
MTNPLLDPSAFSTRCCIKEIGFRDASSKDVGHSISMEDTGLNEQASAIRIRTSFF